MIDIDGRMSFMPKPSWTISCDLTDTSQFGTLSFRVLFPESLRLSPVPFKVYTGGQGYKTRPKLVDRHFSVKNSVGHF